MDKAGMYQSIKSIETLMQKNKNDYNESHQKEQSLTAQPVAIS